MDGRRDEVGPTLFALGAATILGLTSAILLALLWRYVPAQAAFLEGLGAPLPFLTRVVIAASNWMIRLLPFLILLVPPPLMAVLILAVVVAVKKRQMRRFAHAAAALCLALALAEVVASAVVVYSLRSAAQQGRSSR